MINCTKCGNNNPQGASFCSNCGTTLDATIVDKSPFGIEYESSKSNNPFGVGYDNSYSQQIQAKGGGYNSSIHNPYYATAEHSERQSWSNFVYITILIIGLCNLLNFISWTYTSSILFANIDIPTGIVSRALPDIFVTYRLTFVFGLILALIVGVCGMVVVWLSRRLQYKSISIHSKEERIKIVKFIVPLYIVMLIAVVALVVVAAIMSGTGVELTNSLLDDGWSKEEIKNFLNTVSIDFEIDNELGIIYNVFFVILQYGWQLVFLCIGIYKCINISKFLKQKS